MFWPEEHPLSGVFNISAMAYYSGKPAGEVLAMYMGKEVKKKADERYCMDRFVEKYNADHLDDFKIDSEGDAPDFHLKNSKNLTIAVEVTSVYVSYNGKPLHNISEEIKSSINRKDDSKYWRNAEMDARKILLIDCDQLLAGLNWSDLQAIFTQEPFKCLKNSFDECYVVMNCSGEWRYLQMI